MPLRFRPRVVSRPSPPSRRLLPETGVHSTGSSPTLRETPLSSDAVSSRANRRPAPMRTRTYSGLSGIHLGRWPGAHNSLGQQRQYSTGHAGYALELPPRKPEKPAATPTGPCALVVALGILQEGVFQLPGFKKNERSPAGKSPAVIAQTEPNPTIGFSGSR